MFFQEREGAPQPQAQRQPLLALTRCPQRAFRSGS